MKTTRETITFLLPIAQKQFLQAYADHRGVSMTQVLRGLIDKLEKSENTNQTDSFDAVKIKQMIDKTITDVINEQSRGRGVL